MIDGELTTCLLNNGSQLIFMTPAYAIKRGFNIMSLECLAAVATPLSDVANKTLSPTKQNEIMRTSSKVQVPPFGHKIIHGKTGLILQGYKMNIMTHGLKKRLPQLPLGIEVLYSYATLTTGSD